MLLLLTAVVTATVVLARRDPTPSPTSAAGAIRPASGPGSESQDAARIPDGTATAAETAAPAPLAAAAGLGPRRAATVPAETSQVVVVRGAGRTSALATVDLYQRSGGGWVRAAGWAGHNGVRGWTDDHREGDLRTPTGTYSLTDAGGSRPDPGTALPYHRSTSFVPRGDSVFGDSLEGSFDYVVAIDYNRRRDRSPLDTTRPQGWDDGGGIWLHVDHGGPTHGCVSLPEDGMRQLLTALRPQAHPLVVMGDPSFLRT